MNTIFYLSKKKINAKSLAPIYCRITINGERAEFSTGIAVKPTEWNGNEVINTTLANIHNATLSGIKTKIYTIQLNMSLAGKQTTATGIKNKFHEKLSEYKNVVQLINEVMVLVNQSTTITESTKFNYSIKRNNVMAFLSVHKKKAIDIADITIELCQSMEKHFKKKQFAYAHINKHIHFFGQVIKHAMRSGLITHNVLLNYQYKKDEAKPIISLSVSELQLMEHYKFASPKLQYIADLYVFQCYTGFAFVDLMQFDASKHIQLIDGKQYIVKNRGKTNVEALIPLFGTTVRLLLKYDNELPYITNQKYNQYIKEVAEVLGIDKHLTTHTARKTFAMIKLNEGFTIESVARMMGHNSTKITQQTYARVTHVRIGREALQLGVA